MSNGKHPDPGYVSRGGAWIHPGARIADGVVVEPGALIGDQVTIGPECWIGAGAVIYGPTQIGSGNQIFPHAVIGAAPQDIGYAGEPTRLEIGDGNVLREGVTIHRGTVKGGGVTRIGNGVYVMADGHIGHDCRIDDRVILTNNVLIAGHCHIQTGVYMAGRVSIVQFTTVGRYAFVTGLSGTTMDVEPFLTHTGVPARPRSVNVVGLRRAGFSKKSIRSLMEAFKLLFTSSSKGGEDLAAVRDELERRGASSDEASELLEFMKRSRAGKFGRMLQGAAAGGAAIEIDPADDPEMSKNHPRFRMGSSDLGEAAATELAEPAGF
jgi:UDP-N-acetylglucosamine acyltransferase